MNIVKQNAAGDIKNINSHAHTCTFCFNSASIEEAITVYSVHVDAEGTFLTAATA